MICTNCITYKSNVLTVPYQHMRNSLLTDNSLALDVLTGNDETIDFEDILRGKLLR